MRLEHIAIWVDDIEQMRSFYEVYFDAKAGPQYTNPEKAFTSHFLTFDSGARLEIMHRPKVSVHSGNGSTEKLGYAHLAISVGSEAAVDALIECLKADGYEVLDGPRRTGEGYYEGIVLDPEENRIEITV